MDKYMEIAKNNALQGIRKGEGGPFGAVIVKDGVVIAGGNNKVLLNNDPTAHGEITAIREACKKLGTYDLSGCVLYTSAYPCPMCLGAIMWSNIKEVYYGCTKEDTAAIGFRDDDMYEFIKGNKLDTIKLTELNRIECQEAFNEYKGTIY